MQISTYTADTVKIIQSCTFGIVHPDTKKLVPVTFYIANNNGSILLSCEMTLVLCLIQPRSRLDYLPPWASLITSTMDHLRKTKLTSLKIHRSKWEVSDQRQEPQSHAQTSASMNRVQKWDLNMVVTSKEQIISNYSDIFEGIGRFPGPPYHIQVNPNNILKQTPCWPVPIHPKEAFKKEIDKMLQAGIITPVKEATLWINSFILIEVKDKLGNPELCICLNLTNLNKAIVCEPYHFKSLEDITHLIASSCILTICDCKKGYWHQELDESLSFLIILNTKLGRFWYTVMPFGITMAGDILQWKLDQCFSHLKNITFIADDIMVVGKNHIDHDLALTALLEAARKCNIWLNYDKLQYKKTEVDFFGETYMIDGCKPAQTKVSAITSMPEPRCKKEVQSFIGMINYLSKFSARLSEPIRELTKERVPLTGDWNTEKLSMQ